MKKQFLKFSSVVIAAILAMPAILPTKACTGVIVGGDLTEDGTTIFGRTEDLEVNHNKAYKVHPAGEHKANSTMIDCGMDCKVGYTHTFSHDSYQYTSVSDTTPEDGEFAEAGFNEKGVIADMTVSAHANDEVLKVDNYVEEANPNYGISEGIITTVILSESDSALDGIKRIATIFATKGSAEGNAFVIADKNELWYMEVYTGHQFLAMKYPRDKYSVFPNTFWINEVTLEKGEETEHYLIDKTNNYIYSKGLFDVAEKAGTFVGNKEKGVINAAASYAPSEYRSGERYRVYSGIKALNPKSSVQENDQVYHFLQTAPNKTISLKDVFAVTRNRLENIGKVGSEARNGLYPIGNRNTMESHVFQIGKNATTEYPGVMWLALASPRFSPYIPYYPNQTSGIEQASSDSNEFTEKSVYWLAEDCMHTAETDLAFFNKIVEKYIPDFENKLVSNTSINPMDAQSSTMKNHQDAKAGYELLKKMHTEMKEAYEKYLQEKETTTTTYNRRNGITAVVVAPKGTANVRLQASVDRKGTTVSIGDVYGNEVKELAHPVELTLTSKKFEEGKDYTLTINGEQKTAKAVSGTLTFKIGPEENPVEPEQPAEPTKVVLQVKKVDSKLEGYPEGDYEAYEISFVDAQGNVVKDGKMREVAVTLEKLEAKDVKVIHRKADNSTEEIKTIKSRNGKVIVFEHNDFSPFYFVKAKTEVKSTVNTGDNTSLMAYSLAVVASLATLAFALKKHSK